MQRPEPAICNISVDSAATRCGLEQYFGYAVTVFTERSQTNVSGRYVFGGFTLILIIVGIRECAAILFCCWPLRTAIVLALGNPCHRRLSSRTIKKPSEARYQEKSNRVSGACAKGPFGILLFQCGIKGKYFKPLDSRIDYLNLNNPHRDRLFNKTSR